MYLIFFALDGLYFPLWAPLLQRIIVQCVANLTHVKSLNFSHNEISSLIELTKLNCPKVEELNLSFNNVSLLIILQLSENYNFLLHYDLLLRLKASLVLT